MFETMKCRYDETEFRVENDGWADDLRIQMNGPEEGYTAFAYITIEKSRELRKMLKRAEKRAAGV